MALSARPANAPLFEDTPVVDADHKGVDDALSEALLSGHFMLANVARLDGLPEALLSFGGLRTLSAVRCGMRSLDPSFGLAWRQLRIVNLHSNRLRELPPRCWEDLPSLTELNLYVAPSPSVHYRCLPADGKWAALAWPPTFSPPLLQHEQRPRVPS